jgi:membrane protein
MSVRASRTSFRRLRQAWVEYETDYARYFAGAIVYYALVSLLPLVLLAFAGLGLLLRFTDLAVPATQELLDAVRTGFGEELMRVLEGLILRLEEQSVVATVISLLGLMWASSKLFAHLRMTFRAIWKQAPPIMSGSPRRAVWAILLERIVALTMVLAGGALLLAGTVVLTMLAWLGRFIGGLPAVGRVAAWLLATLSPAVIAFTVFALLLRFLPPIRQPWRTVFLAALLCAVAWLLGAELMGLYVTHFGANLGAYGAIGAILLLMLWMNLVTKVLFYGAELCKVTSSSSGRPTFALADRASPSEY